MKIRGLFVLGVVLLLGTAAFAQDWAKVEVPLDYSYMRFNPQNNNIVSAFSLNGGGGGVAVYLSHWIGIQADFQGYGSLNKTFIFPATANSPCPAGCTVVGSGNLFTYNVGVVLKKRYQHFEPFVETLFGGAHSNTYSNLFHNLCVNPGTCTSTHSPSNNAFDFIIGGGIGGLSVAVALARTSATTEVFFSGSMLRNFFNTPGLWMGNSWPIRSLCVFVCRLEGEDCMGKNCM